MSSGRVGKAIVLTCFFTAGYGRHRKLGVGFRTAGYGWHRSQWVKYHKNVMNCTNFEQKVCKKVLFPKMCYLNVMSVMWNHPWPAT